MSLDGDTILLADADAREQQPLKKVLARAGYRVITAASSAEVLDRLEEAPDLILFDLGLPGKSPMTTLEQLLAESETRPVIVLSATGDLSLVAEALGQGASDYFLKPIPELALLESSVRRCLEQAWLRQENQRYRDELEATNRELTRSLAALQVDQQAGRHVQMRMLPPSPKRIGRVKCTHRILPSLYLSGDFIDYFKVGRAYLVFLMADVSGHGASSAFVTVLLKNLAARLRSHYTHDDDDTILMPGRFLAKANEELLALGLGKHATVFAGCLDTRSDTLCYSIGAHFPMPLLLHGKRPRFLKGKGKPVGLFPKAEYPEYTLELPETYTLLLFSDGILELLDGKTLSDKERRLRQVLNDRVHTADQALSALGVETSAELPDDVAVLALTRRRPHG